MSSDYQCEACGSTGINSRGGACVPCQKNGRQLLRNAVISATKVVFAKALEAGRLPDPCELRSAIDWAYQPRVMFAAGYRDPDGSMAMFAGPTPRRENITYDISPDENDPRPAFIVELIKADVYREEPTVRPNMKWKDGFWVGRRKS